LHVVRSTHRVTLIPRSHVKQIPSEHYAVRWCRRLVLTVNCDSLNARSTILL
jgi:hypothetical protein